MPLYEYAVIRRDKDGQEQLVVKPTAVVAKDENHARVLAGAGLGDHGEDAFFDQLEVLVRPFCR